MTLQVTLQRDSRAIESHWFDDPPGALLERIDDALRAAGHDPARVSVDDLSAIDEFHIRGREATEELLALAGISASDSVLDVGAGIGGPSRFLASRVGCKVTGIDLTREYCDVATELSERVGLGDRLTYRQGNALDLPFDDESFDVVWTQHISMNIRDKDRFFGEMLRVLRPGGRLALYDPIAGDGRDLTFPVPWSRDGRFSFLIDSDETRAALEGAGFEVVEWRDRSQRSLDWFQKQQGSGPPSPLNLGLLMGGEWPTMAANMVANLASGKLAVIQVVARRPR